MVLPASEGHEINPSVRRALRLVMTTGIGSDEPAALPAGQPDA